ncbi:unnamed protein product [Rotaria sp. Silwood2]|nr:unnamed protein product [Rotaria sp. Silwood2]CAF2837473.1 unnamed protein product [Rotaria sp. Silwood2]CAF3566629.1 unnamed protein product [Rotaria sp. Silwood2]CAF3921787.1 unnamed protein product [Rotaria sp. Silwood2]CAF4066653.1 unnamed protein product [Rotaria sp. Silwood2]
MPNKIQSTAVVNTDEIARKLEAVCGIKSGSIYISTIVITHSEPNADGRHHQVDSEKREIPKCDQLESVSSIVKITMHIIYPARCGISMRCKKEFADVIQARLVAYSSIILLEFKFDDDSFSELALTRCKSATDSSLNSSVRSRRAAKATTTKS